MPSSTRGSKTPALKAAGETGALSADPLLPDHIPVALDQQLAAVRAPRMLPAPDPAREIARVDELEAGRRPDLTRSHQRFGRRVVGVGHPVVLVERGDVPRDLGAHRRG